MSLQTSAAHPDNLGPAILAHIKKGKMVERITVWFTVADIHRLFSDAISKNYPMEMTLAPGMDMEKKIDLRLHPVAWHIDIRTEQQKRDAAKVQALQAKRQVILDETAPWTEKDYAKVASILSRNESESRPSPVVPPAHDPSH